MEDRRHRKTYSNAFSANLLAVVSLFQKRAGKAFGIIGLVLAVLVLCSICGVFAWAFLMPK